MTTSIKRKPRARRRPKRPFVPPDPERAELLSKLAYVSRRLRTDAIEQVLRALAPEPMLEQPDDGCGSETLAFNGKAILRIADFPAVRRSQEEKARDRIVAMLPRFSLDYLTSLGDAMHKRLMGDVKSSPKTLRKADDAYKREEIAKIDDLLPDFSKAFLVRLVYRLEVSESRSRRADG